MKHTKGKWGLHETPHGLIRVVKGAIDIATIYDESNLADSALEVKETQRANANLISKAPEMLEMLIKLRTWYEDVGFVMLEPSTPIVFSEAKYLIDSLNDKTCSSPK